MSQNYYNSNFLDEAGNYQVDETIQSVESDYSQQEEANLVVNEAIRRIEQAKLYEALLRNSLFDPSTGRPEIIAVVEKEMKGFILSRLEHLLGIKPAAQESQAVAVDLPFTEEQVSALKALADRMLTKQPAPTMQTVSEPTIKPLASTSPSAPTAPIRAVSAPAARQPQVAQPRPAQAPAKAPAAQKRPGRKKSQNVSEFTGQDYSQSAGDPEVAARRLPMPSADQMNAMAAVEAQRNQASIGGAMSREGQILQSAVLLAQKQNSHVSEE